MEQLILASGKTFLHQDAAFFKKEKSGFSMTFCNYTFTEDNRRIEARYIMHFREDFITALTKYESLPSKYPYSGIPRPEET